jgi:hypothetical protein
MLQPMTTKRNHNQDDPGHLDAYDHCREQSDFRHDGEQTETISPIRRIAVDHPRRKSLAVSLRLPSQST